MPIKAVVDLPALPPHAPHCRWLQGSRPCNCGVELLAALVKRARPCDHDPGSPSCTLTVAPFTPAEASASTATAGFICVVCAEVMQIRYKVQMP